jgi:hypothetical protein
LGHDPVFDGVEGEAEAPECGCAAASGKL